MQCSTMFQSVLLTAVTTIYCNEMCAQQDACSQHQQLFFFLFLQARKVCGTKNYRHILSAMLFWKDINPSSLLITPRGVCVAHYLAALVPFSSSLPNKTRPLTHSKTKCRQSRRRARVAQSQVNQRCLGGGGALSCENTAYNLQTPADSNETCVHLFSVCHYRRTTYLKRGQHQP